MGQNNDFLQKCGQKTAFLSITILDHPTLDWAGTQNFKGIANFNMCFEKCGTSASKLAMGNSASHVHLFWIFMLFQAVITVKLNFKAGLFSSTFPFEHSFLAKSQC